MLEIYASSYPLPIACVTTSYIVIVWSQDIAIFSDSIQYRCLISYFIVNDINIFF